MAPTKTCNPQADLKSLGNETDSLLTGKEFSNHPMVPSVDTLMKAIPKKCFEPSFLWSFFFIFRDMAFAGINMYLFFTLEKFLPSWLKVPYWIIFGLVQGTILTGLWVIGHECGHGAFCRSQVLCDSVGMVVHSSLLVPYFSWQYSHHKHHQHTNHLTWGETHNPRTLREKERYLRITHALFGEDGFLIWTMGSHLLAGWLVYLFTNATGGRVNYKGEPINKSKAVSHFNPVDSELYPPEMRFKVGVSTFGILVVLAILGYCTRIWGWPFMLKAYWLPYIVVNSWVVLITRNQHTHPNVPHLDDDAFTWLRGSLCTIDRYYPWIIDELHHHIGTTHVLHHLCPRIPHYYAEEATQAIIPVLGKLYRKDEQGLWTATKESYGMCLYVDDFHSVQYYKNMTDLRLRDKQ